MAARRGSSALNLNVMMTERARQSPAKRGFSIALLLFLFGASLVVPALAFTAVLLDRNWQAQEARTRRRLEQLVGDLAHDVDRELTLLLADLAALAASPDVAAGDWAAVHTKARASLKLAGHRSPVPRRRRPASDEHAGRLGHAAAETEQPAIDPAVRANLKPHVSDMVAGRIAGRQVITLTVPVMGGEERLAGYLMISIDPEQLLGLDEGQNLPPGWNTGLSDRNGVIVARLRRHESGSSAAAAARNRQQIWRARQRLRTVNMVGVRRCAPPRLSSFRAGWFRPTCRCRWRAPPSSTTHCGRSFWAAPSFLPAAAGPWPRRWVG